MASFSRRFISQGSAVAFAVAVVASMPIHGQSVTAGAPAVVSAAAGAVSSPVVRTGQSPRLINVKYEAAHHYPD